MGRYCSVFGCTNQGKSTFSFPNETDKKRRKIWINFVNKNRRNKKGGKTITKWKMGETSCICSNHFEDSAFTNKDGQCKRLRLKNDAVPTKNQVLAESSSQETEFVLEIPNQQLAGSSSADIGNVLENPEEELELQQEVNPPLIKKRKCSESSGSDQQEKSSLYEPSEPSTESEEPCTRYISFTFFNSIYFIKIL